MGNNETTGSRLDKFDEYIRKYYLHTLTLQGVSASEKQCEQWMESLKNQNSYAAWVLYIGTMHNNYMVPMKGKLSFLHSLFDVNSEDTKDFLSQLVMFSKGQYDEKTVKAGLVKVGIKSGIKVVLNTKRSRMGRSVFNSLKQSDTVYESFDTACVFYGATHVFLLNKQIRKHSQQDSVYEGLCAYQFFMDEKNDRLLNLFK